MKNKMIFIFLLCFNLAAYAEKVLPIFTGNWYEETVGDAVVDNCDIPHWSYKNISSNKDIVINGMFKDLPKRDGCEWQKPRFDSFADDRLPQDFPTTDIDVMASSAKPEWWVVDCKRPPPNDDQNLESDLRAVYPSYICPAGSRLTSDETGTFCSNTPNVCVADVVGRQLKVPPIEDLGHVGLTTPIQNESRPLHFGNYVLEVLNEKIVININTLQSFEHSIPNGYWGEVYGLDDSGFVPFIPAVNAIRAGIAQSAFEPEYTFTAEWQEGSYLKSLVYDSSKNKFVNSEVKVRAKFRCDTFVNYCYAKGFGSFIETAIILPRIVYNKFHFQRNDVPPQINPSNNSKNLAQFNATFNKSELYSNIHKFDQSMKEYVQNPNISRQIKLQTLWNKAQENDIDVTSYMLDTLSSMRAYEMIPTFIQEYDNESNIEKKSKLIYAISESTKVNIFEKNLMNDRSKIIKNIISAQQFFIKLLQYENVPLLLHQAIANGITILPINPNNYNLFLEAINRLKLQPEDKSHFSIQSKYAYIISMVFSNIETQEFALPRLLAQPLEPTEKDIFNKQLYLRLKDIEESSISKKIKQQLKSYVVSTQNQKSQLATQIEYLYAIASLSSKNKSERDRYVLDFVNKQSDRLIQANLILSLDQETISNLSQSEKIKLSNIFREKYKMTHHLLYLKAINIINYKK